jgi:hypothetical protein
MGLFLESSFSLICQKLPDLQVSAEKMRENKKFPAEEQKELYAKVKKETIKLLKENETHWDAFTVELKGLSPTNVKRITGNLGTLGYNEAVAYENQEKTAFVVYPKLKGDILQKQTKQEVEYYQNQQQSNYGQMERSSFENQQQEEAIEYGSDREWDPIQSKKVAAKLEGFISDFCQTKIENISDRLTKQPGLRLYKFALQSMHPKIHDMLAEKCKNKGYDVGIEDGINDTFRILNLKDPDADNDEVFQDGWISQAIENAQKQNQKLEQEYIPIEEIQDNYAQEQHSEQPRSEQKQNQNFDDVSWDFLEQPPSEQ